MSRHATSPRGDAPAPSARPGRKAALALALALLVGVAAPAAWALSRTRPYGVWAAGRALDRSDPDRAAVLLGPWKASDDAEVVLLLAEAQVARGLPDSAARLLEARLRRRDDPRWLAMLGEVYLGLDQPSRALEVFEALDARKPDHPPTLARIAALTERLRGPSEAERLYGRLSLLEPEQAEWPRRRGIVFLEMDRYGLAADALRSAIALDPEDVEARFRLAEALYLGGEPGPALEQLELCRQQGGDDDRVEVARAECLRGLGRPAEAATVLDALLARSPGNADALRLRGELALGAGEVDRALTLLDRAAEAAPRDWRVQYQLSVVLARLGRVEEARRHSERMEEERERDRIAPGP